MDPWRLARASAVALLVVGLVVDTVSALPPAALHVGAAVVVVDARRTRARVEARCPVAAGTLTGIATPTDNYMRQNGLFARARDGRLHAAIVTAILAVATLLLARYL